MASRLTRKRDGWLEKHRIRSVYALATNPEIIRILEHWGYGRGKRLV
jgi:hypothetical protein